MNGPATAPVRPLHPREDGPCDGQPDGDTPPPVRSSFVGALARMVGQLTRATADFVWKHRVAFAIWAAFMAFGWWLAVRIDLVVLDALSRSAHAGFVWHNGPPKLAGLGFAWPPMATLPMLPFAAVSWIAATGLAGVIVSGLATALLLVLVHRELVRVGLPRWAAASTAAMLGIHPMVAYYGANGMSEALSLLFGTAVLVGIMRWLDHGRIGQLVLVSFAAAYAMLIRYELGVLAVIAAAGVAWIVARRERSVVAGRATAIFVLTPTIYAAVVWMYFSWTIQGSPFWFLTSGYQLATVEGSAETIGQDSVLAGFGRWDSAAEVLLAQLALAPGIVIVGILCARAIWRRNPGALLVSALVFANLATMLALAVAAANPWMSQLRFNMRTIPLVLVAAAWLLRPAESAARRRVATIVVLACALAAIPTSAWRMHTAPVQFTEASFIEAITERRPLTGRQDVGGQTIGCRPAREMAARIKRLAPGRDTILADDSAQYAVMTYTGRPDWFVDRVDKGEAYFADMVNRPAGRIRYVLASNVSYCVGVNSDLINQRWPDLYETGNDGYLDLVLETDGFRLYRLPNSQRFEPPRGTEEAR